MTRTAEVGGSVASSSNQKSRRNLQQLAQVGPVRAMRLRRDTDIRTIDDVAQADLSTLMQVWSVGPVISRRMQGSAQGHVQERERKIEEYMAEGRDDLSRHKQVAVLSGRGAFDRLGEGREANETIMGALEFADVVSQDDDSDTPSIQDVEMDVGFCPDGMGGAHVSFWLDREMFSNHDLTKKKFHTPWDKYSKFVEPMKFIDIDWKKKHDVWDIEEVPKGRLPDTCSMDEIPFADREEDVQKWMAPAERTNKMVEWADEVVIVLDGKYAEQVRKSCEFSKTKCTTVFAKPRGDGEVRMWTPDEDDTPDFKPDSDEQATGGRGVAGGVDLESDDHFRDKPFDTDDAPRTGLDMYNTSSHQDGTGVGSKMNKWG